MSNGALRMLIDIVYDLITVELLIIARFIRKVES